MNLLNVSIPSLVVLCIATVGISSNLIYFIDNSGTLFGPRFSVVALGLVLCALIFITHASQRRRQKNGGISTWLAVGFWPNSLLTLQMIALIRTMVSEEYLSEQATFFLITLIMLASIFFISGRYLFSIARQSDYWKSLAWGVIVLSFASILLRIVGFTGDTPEDLHSSVSLALIGINATRPSMPLFTGINGAGVIFGAAVVCATILARGGGLSLKSALVFLLGVASLIALLFVDTRGAILATLTSLFITLFHKRILASIMLLIFITSGVALLSGDLEGSFALSRPGQELTTSRNTLWSEASEALLDPKVIHVIGYGAWGQYVSGLSNRFYGLFSDDLFETATLHNALLQTFFDCGYVGAVFYIICWFVLIRFAWLQHVQEESELSALRLGLAIYIVASGFFEAINGYSSISSMFLYVGALVGFSAELVYKHKLGFGAIVGGRNQSLFRQWGNQ